MQYFLNAKKVCYKFSEKETCSWLQLDAEDIVAREGEILLGFHGNLVKQETSNNPR